MPDDSFARRPTPRDIGFVTRPEEGVPAVPLGGPRLFGGDLADAWNAPVEPDEVGRLLASLAHASTQKGPVPLADRHARDTGYEPVGPPEPPPPHEPPMAVSHIEHKPGEPTIGASRMGERYRAPGSWNELVGSEHPLQGILEHVIGPSRPPSVYAADPTGVETWLKYPHSMPPPLMAAATEEVGANATRGLLGHLGIEPTPSPRVGAPPTGQLVHPRVEVGNVANELAPGSASAAYQPASGRVMLDRDAVAAMSPTERAELVRHELAHKVETEGEHWKDSDTALWNLWEKDRQHPIFDFMADKTGRWKFDNNQSPEIMAHLYSSEYPKGTFTVKDRPVPYEHEAGQSYPREYPIPSDVMSVLDQIEAKLGIWGKKAARGTAPAPPPPPVIKAFHGSHADFPPEPGAPLGRFDPTKIGTGEGAQAFSHGHYSAEAEPVAKGYQRGVSRAKGEQPRWEHQGQPVDERTTRALELAGPKHANEDVPAYLQRAITELQNHGEFIDKAYGPEGGGALYRRNAEALSALDPTQVTFKEPGHMYELAIHADPAHFLDWEKPLSQQHPIVQEAVQKAGVRFRQPDPTGEQIWGQVADHAAYGRGLKLSADQIMRPGADLLRDAGVPGVRYLDQESRLYGDAQAMVEKYGSREAALGAAKQRLRAVSYTGINGDMQYWDNVVRKLQTPETRNNVVFPGNEHLIEILRKYGLLPPLAAGLLGRSSGQHDPEQVGAPPPIR